MDLGSETLEWQAPDGTPWLVTVHLAEVDGRAECVGLEVRSFRGERERVSHPDLPDKDQAVGIVSASLIRSVPVGRMLTEAKAVARTMAEEDAEIRPVSEDVLAMERKLGVEGALAYWRMKRHDDAIQRLPALRKGGRPPLWGDDHYLELARVYLTSVDAPTKAVAEHFHITRSAAAKQVAKARELGLIGHTTRGKPSGRPIAVDGGEGER